MDKVTEVLNHPEFKKSLARVEACEQDRIFCKHGLPHLLDTARIAWIMNLEGQLGYDKETIYLAGLLHDVGKYLQYETGEPHDIASERIARGILTSVHVDETAIALICKAILHHRKLQGEDKSSLDYILYTADKRSRGCYGCKASDQCNWSDEKKNWTVTY